MPSTYRLSGINFSPYTNPDEDPNRNVAGQITNEELRARLGMVAPYTEWVRSFGCTDDLAPIGKVAHEMGLKAAIGAWLGRDESANRAQVDALVELARQGHVDLAIVGSEVMLRGDLTEERLLEYIREVKTRLKAAGMDIPVTTGDVYGEYLAHPALVTEVDVVFINLYPYWEARSIDCAVAYVHRWYQQVKLHAQGKPVVVSETGWPSCGDRRGDAVPSPENAADYFLTFVSWARANSVQYFYFEALPEPWKAHYEGPQGACWSILDSSGKLKPGMERVFQGEQTADRWTTCAADEPVLDFFTMPDRQRTNLRNFLVAASADSGNDVYVNGIQLGAGTIDDLGHFANVIILKEGDNSVEVVVKSRATGMIVKQQEKVVQFDPSYSTANQRLIYVDLVSDGPISIEGTAVLDLDGNCVLGIIPEKHVRGISANTREIYKHDRSVLCTSNHVELRKLPFSQDLPLNGIAVSPDGRRIYSRDEIVNISSNILAPWRLAGNIETGSSWSGAPIPGGPAISPDGRFIYAQNQVVVFDTITGILPRPTGFLGHFMSDIKVSPDHKRVVVSQYSSAAGSVVVADAATLAPIITLGGPGDFAGEMVFIGNTLVVGSSGNPTGGGRLVAIDLDTGRTLSSVELPLADNLTVSERGEVFVSVGLPDLV